MSFRLGNVSPSGTGLPSSGGTLSGNTQDTNSSGWQLRTGAGAVSTPTIIPNRSGTTYGFGGDGTTVSVVVNGVGRYQFSNGSFSVDSTAFLDSRGRVTNSTAVLNLGTSAATSHSLVAGDVVDGGKLEVDGQLFADQTLLTVGTMTATTTALVQKAIHRYDWTNAMVTALPTTAGDIAVCTLPAKTIVTNAYIVITGAAVGPTTVTVALGRVSASYIDYIVASDAKAAANTVYGDASAERGTNLTGYDLPNFTGTTVINAHFVSTGANLSTTTGSTGSVYLETMTLP